MVQKFWPAVLAGLMTLVPHPESIARDTAEARVARLTSKDSLIVLVTDSGLGGLSVCADIESRARQTGLYRRLKVVFANALPEANRGYNRMRSTADKIAVFDGALKGMTSWYAPDVILVACNTLSVLIPETPFVTAGPLPVLGIVETGVEMLHDRLTREPGSTALIFGTETTIEADTHRKLLMAKGIDPARIVPQACPNLAGEIEADAQSDMVRTAIDLFVSEALERTAGATEGILAGLCCTHYGYVARQFEEALRGQGIANPEVVDPNARMSDVLFPQDKPRRSDAPDVTVEVVSRAFISPSEIASIRALIQPASPATAEALSHYTLNTDLFPYNPADE